MKQYKRETSRCKYCWRIIQMSDKWQNWLTLRSINGSFGWCPFNINYHEPADALSLLAWEVNNGRLPRPAQSS